MATALFFFSINIIGMIAGPYLVALLTENLFDDPNSIASAIAIIAAAAWVIAMSLLVFGFKFYQRRISDV